MSKLKSLSVVKKEGNIAKAIVESQCVLVFLMGMHCKLIECWSKQTCGYNFTLFTHHHHRAPVVRRDNLNDVDRRGQDAIAESDKNSEKIDCDIISKIYRLSNVVIVASLCRNNTKH